ncbi:hypothetical protein TRFO_25206 [Tritrichomonas foetus]|uniref:Uncharacterized protein n=1 Tax=Tritrichomonas foetus TaxID=1144522 RepID=A0A1J4K5E0_9EUKA|nr:hypothetical protein TRFO_25206 [Tritrichomonas foetus]|eukprot:OHT06673.1 hypothetical protein TRFO_25206 [Tritrichomonas foetus]
MTFLSLSFREWPYPTKQRKKECCAWGECGFLAYSLGNSVTIYSNEIGRFSPMYMWSPFEHEVSCMGWYDGSCTPSIVQPLLAIGNIKGSIAVFDVRNKNVLGKASFKGDVPLTLMWSPFYRSRFYIGTKNGFLNCMQMDEKTQPDIAIRAQLNLGFSVDFIAIDPQTGTTVAVASKDGHFTVISSITNTKSSDTFKSYTLPLKDSKDTITTLSFFPDQPNFLILSTQYTSHLFSIHEQATLPYIQTEGIRFISSPSKSTNRIIIGYDDAISLWQYNSDGWRRLSMTTFSTLKGIYPEAKMYTSLDDKVIVFSESHWLTVIEEHYDKLFIAQRIKMMPSKPLDWDFRKGSIAFVNESGSVMVTSWTPDAVIQPQTGFGGVVSMDDLASTMKELRKEDNFNILDEDNENSPYVEEYDNSYSNYSIYNQNNDFNEYDKGFNNFNNSNNFSGFSNLKPSLNTFNEFHNNNDLTPKNTHRVTISDNMQSILKTDNESKTSSGRSKGATFSQLMESNDLEIDVDQGEFENAFDFSTNFVSIPASHVKAAMSTRRSSKAIREDVKKIWKQMVDDSSSPTQIQPLLLPVEVNSEEYKNIKVPGETNQSLCGNSNTLLLSFQIASFPINHVMWGPGGKLIVWTFHDGKNTLEMIDFKKRETKTLLAMQLNAINVPITRIFFSEDRSIFCIIIGEQTAVFMSIASAPKQIGSLTFNSPVIGSFGPTGYDCVFLSKNSTLYRVTVNIIDGATIKKKYKLPSKRGEPTFISWVNSGLIVGTALGKVHVYYGPGFSEYRSIITITNPVEYVYQSDNNAFFIMDNQRNAVIHKTLEDIPINGKVNNIKPASPDTFLMNISGSGKLVVLSTTGKFSPLPPPCVSRCPLVQDPVRYQRELNNLVLRSPDEAIKACRLYGAIFIMRLIQAKQNPNALSEHLSWLNGLISECVNFSSWAIRLALKVGDNATARNILLMTSPSSPDYIINLTKAALFDTHQPGEAVETVAQSLFENNKNDEAIDVLLITGAVDIAVKHLIDQGNIRDAAMLLRMRRDKTKIFDLYHKVANMLIDQRKLMLGLIMLSEGGFNGEMVGLISSIIGVEFSHLLSFLDENDVHY